MTQWTNIPDETLEPGRPIRSVDGLALRDNPVAIAEGASGAPRIAGQQGPAVETGGIANSAVTTAKINNSAVTTSKLESSERLTTGNIAPLIGNMSRGGVGTYSFLVSDGSEDGGSTRSGSGLSYAAINSDGDLRDAGTPPGTWRNMGRSVFLGWATVWLRIS